MKLKLLLPSVCLASSLAFSAYAAESSEVWLQQAVNSSSRTDVEKVRDINRKPIETLKFFGLQPNMKVVELMPGKGWYSKILSAALAEKGQFYAAFNTRRIPEYVKYTATGALTEFQKQAGAGYIFNIASANIGVTDADRVLTFRNIHNFTAPARAKLNKAAFDALKSGGVYGVVDHSKRHMEDFTEATWRRIDPVLIIKEAVQAGFIFEDFSTLHARAEDTLQFDTKHKSLVNESDRFTLKFRKP